MLTMCNVNAYYYFYIIIISSIFIDSNSAFVHAKYFHICQPPDIFSDFVPSVIPEVISISVVM